MAEKLDPKETVTIKDLAISSTWEMAALVEVLERKGCCAKQEVLMSPYRSRGGLGNTMALHVLVLTLGGLFAASDALSSDSATATNEDQPPWFFKVYSQAGRENLTARCSPKDMKTEIGSATEVKCQFTHVRFNLPSVSDDVSKYLIALRSPEEAAKMDPELREEFRKDPEKARKKWNEEMKKIREEMCSAKSRSEMETHLRNPSAGPKRKARWEKVIRACAGDSSGASIMEMIFAWEKSTCQLYVDRFSLDFRKTRAGHWLYTQETPGLLSNAIKVYELTADGPVWTLTETRLSMNKPKSEETQQSSQRTVWTWNTYPEYEVPAECDFISHDQVQAPF